jgi:hypothetical protein
MLSSMKKGFRVDQQALEGFQREVVAQEGAQELARAVGRQRVQPQLAERGLAPPRSAGMSSTSRAEPRLSSSAWVSPSF